MAIIANVASPYTASADLVTWRAFAFLLTPSAAGFVTDGDDIEKPKYTISPPYHLTSALATESTYLEPTTGQIWPR